MTTSEDLKRIHDGIVQLESFSTERSNNYQTFTVSYIDGELKQSMSIITIPPIGIIERLKMFFDGLFK